MYDADRRAPKLGLLTGKAFKSKEVVMGMTHGVVIRGHVQVPISGRLSNWFQNDEGFILLHNASIEGGPEQEFLIVNKDQILWIESDPSEPGIEDG